MLELVFTERWKKWPLGLLLGNWSMASKNLSFSLFENITFPSYKENYTQQDEPIFYKYLVFI